MSKKELHLNHALLHFISECRRDGDWSRLHDMGLSHRQVRDFHSLTVDEVKRVERKLDEYFAMIIKLDCDALTAAMNEARMESDADEIRDALISRNAPADMMENLYGIGAKEYARLRRALNMSDGAGRPTEIDDETANRVWESWESIRSSSAHLRPTRPEQWIRLSDETGADVRAIWRLAKQQWGRDASLKEEAEEELGICRIGPDKRRKKA